MLDQETTPAANEPAIDQDPEIVNLEEVADSERPYLPKDNYVAVITDAAYQVSKGEKKTPYISLNWEIVGPEIKQFRGKAIHCKGVQVQQSLFLTQKALGRLKAFHKKLKLPLGNFNLKNPNIVAYLGVGANIIVTTDSKPEIREGTDEVLQDNDGNEIRTNLYKIVDIICRNHDADRDNIAF